MADYTIMVPTEDGRKIPFRVKGVNSREEAKMKLYEQYKDLDDEGYASWQQNRINELKDLGIDIKTHKELVNEGENSASRFLIGAGKTFKDWYNGSAQFYYQLTGDKEEAKKIRDQDLKDEEIFKLIDEGNIGMEDLGQLAPEVLAFLMPGAAGAKGAKLFAAEIGMGALSGGVGQTTDGFAERQLGAALGAAGAAIPGGVAALGGMRRAVMGAPAATKAYIMELMANPKMTEKVAEAITSNKTPPAIAKALRQKFDRVMNGVPAQEVKLLQQNAAFAQAKNVLAEATQGSYLDVDTAIKGLAKITSADLQRGLSKPAAQAIKDLKKTLQAVADLPPEVLTPQNLSTLADGILAGNSKQFAGMVNALQSAGLKPEAKATVLQQLIQRMKGVAATTAQAPRAAGGAASSNLAQMELVRDAVVDMNPGGA